MTPRESGALKFWRFGNPILWGIVATVMVVLAAVLLGVISTCNGTWWNAEACQTKWAYFLTAPPNEVGDTLAGFAGTLAFVWIIVTVWLQSIELAEQRKELSEQRAATQDMARSMAAQAKIFEDQQRREQEVEHKDTLDELLANLLRMCMLVNRSVTWKVENHEDDYSGLISDEGELLHDAPDYELVRPFVIPKRENLDDRIAELCLSTALLATFWASEDRLSRCVKKANRRFFVSIPELLDQILELVPNLSKSQAVRVASFDIALMKTSLEELIGLDIWEEERSMDTAS